MSIPEGTGTPLSLGLLVGGFVTLTPENVGSLGDYVQPPGYARGSTSRLLHLMRFHGLSGPLRGAPGSCETALATLTDDMRSIEYFDRPPMVATRHGIRYSTLLGNDPSDEDHRDQVLATFAEFGLPLSYPLRLRGCEYHLRDVLRDSVAEFHIGQKEIAWTALAYALYLPPKREWVNHFGERYSFDDLAGELQGRSLQSGSCGGAHMLAAMGAMSQADERYPILTPSMRRRLRDHVRRCADVVVRTQRADGSWPMDWNTELLPGGVRRGRSPSESSSGPLLVTSHLAEWMLSLPTDLVPSETLERASSWLAARLAESTEEGRRKAFCPYTHAACVVRQLALVPGGRRDASPESQNRNRRETHAPKENRR